MRTAAAFVTELGRGFAEAVDPDTELLLLSTTTAPLGWHLAEAMGIRAIGVHLQTTAPSGDFPPNLMGTRSLGRLGNRTAGGLALRMADRVYTEAVTELRRRLDLPSLAAAEMRGATGARELARPARLQHGTGAAPVGLARGTRHRRRLVAVPRSGPSTPR